MRTLSLEEALDLFVPDKWKMCHVCESDAIVLDQDGFVADENGKIIWWLAGQCRACKAAHIHCQDCGLKIYVEKDKSTICGCGHEWYSKEEGICIEFDKEEPEF